MKHGNVFEDLETWTLAKIIDVVFDLKILAPKRRQISTTSYESTEISCILPGTFSGFSGRRRVLQPCNRVGR